MVYRVIGSMSGSSMDGLDLAYCVLSEVGGQWTYELEAAACIPFTDAWKQKLHDVGNCSAKELMLVHTDFGHWMGQAINEFIAANKLEHKVHFIASHGHTVFHEPALGMTFQMGDGASIAAEIQLPVISDLRNMDVAFGGQGAPIVPIGEKYLWSGFTYFLNIGGIANLSIHHDDTIEAFDICPANRVMNALMKEMGETYDTGGQTAASGQCNERLLEELNALDYYHKQAPKSLANEYGLEVVLPIIQQYEISVQDKLNTYAEHIAIQLAESVNQSGRLMVSGGGAHNKYLLKRMQAYMAPKEIDIVIADDDTINYKEAIVMALIGALRWREEENVLSSVTGAKQNSIGGALWMGRN